MKLKVQNWREQHILFDDKDFAFVFTSFEEAYAHGGRAVAKAWAHAGWRNPSWQVTQPRRDASQRRLPKSGGSTRRKSPLLRRSPRVNLP